MRRLDLVPALAFILAASLSSQSIAQQVFTQRDVNSCVTPKAKRDAKNHRLVQIFVDVFARPDPKAKPIYIRLASPMPLGVVAKEAGFLEIVGVPGSPFKDGHEIGWVRSSDVREQDYRNCT